MTDARRHIVNLSVRKTEAGWQKSIDTFYFAVVPLLFNLVGWGIAIGTMWHVASIIDSLFIRILAVLLFFLTNMYLVATCARIHIIWGRENAAFPIDLRKSEKSASFFVGLILALFLVVIVWQTALAISEFEALMLHGDKATEEVT